MINKKSVLAVILARGGSKGLARKNLKLLADMPLVAWSIEAAKHSSYIDRLIVSSDDDEIISIAKEFGCEGPFKRPIELAQDDTPSVDSLMHAINQMPSYDYIVLLQPTSPLRISEDIDGCLLLCEKRDAPACVSLQKANKHPLWMFTQDADDRIHSVLGLDVPKRRQDLSQCYELNGAVYVAKTKWWLEKKSFFDVETCGYIMPKERSIDIDTEIDFYVAEQLITQRKTRG